MSKSKKRSYDRGSPELVVGIAWYSLSQWRRLREVSADPKELEQTYEEWRASCERTMGELAAEGVRAHKVPVDVSELEKWCRRKNRPVDGNARAAYVSEWMQRNVPAQSAISEEWT
jgi:hypothetical protein